MDDPAHSGAYAELLDRLEEGARGNGGGKDGGGNGGGHGGGGGDDGPGMGPLGRLMIEALRRTSEMQSNFTAKSVDALLEAIRAERDARESTARQLHENHMQTSAMSARLAEASADRFDALEARIVSLERELARLRPANADASADEGSGP
jgi:hypothetical protein